MPDGVDASEWGVSPTQQTVRKHRKSSFAKMCDDREIDGLMLQAADEIGEVYDAITCGLTAKSPSNLDRVDGSRQRDMVSAIAFAHKARYKPWADELSRRAKRGGPPALETVFDIVIDGWNTSTVDHSRRWRHGFSKYLVQRALLEYAVMAGWAPMSDLTGFDRAHGSFARRAA